MFTVTILSSKVKNVTKILRCIVRVFLSYTCKQARFGSEEIKIQIGNYFCENYCNSNGMIAQPRAPTCTYLVPATALDF